MRLGYFTMPVHPIHRSWTETLKEDREAIILADKLGFYDAFMGEHLTDKAENVTNSLLFMATLIHSTQNILLGTGTSNLSHSHPTLIASQSAMFDHLAQGRFILGVSPGAGRVLGLLSIAALPRLSLRPGLAEEIEASAATLFGNWVTSLGGR